jgi:hypothetical protein
MVRESILSAVELTTLFYYAVGAFSYAHYVDVCESEGVRPRWTLSTKEKWRADRHKVIFKDKDEVGQ